MENLDERDGFFSRKKAEFEEDSGIMDEEYDE
jgi:hypothetical protein